MLYVQQFQNIRLDYLRQCQRLNLSVDQNFSLCSNQYSKKFPKLSRSEIPNVDYPRSQTLFFLTSKSSSETKSTNDSRQQTEIIQKNKTPITAVLKGSVQDDDKQISNENSPTRWYHQVSRNVNGLAKSTTKSRTPIEPYRSTTAPLIFEENIRRTTSSRIKPNTSSRFLSPHVIDFSDSFDSLTNSSFFRFQSRIFESDNQFMQQSYTDTSSPDHFLDSSIVINPFNEPAITTTTTTTLNNQDKPKILHRNSQYDMNGFQHIANLGSWQHHSKHRKIEPLEKSKEIDHEEDIDYSSQKIYEYKSPFSEEYDQAISLQGQVQTNNNINEWNLKDFYRDVKTPFESGTNTKPVFEKCLKLARLQANTIKWEQRRSQNLNIYNRLIKNPTLENTIANIYGNSPPNVNELKRELRCNECKRVSCLGNCAPGQEYQHYKRWIPLPNTREQIRCKLGLRTQRSMIDIRPRSTQQITRIEQPTNLNPVVVVPLFQDDSQTKRPQKKLTNGFLPGKTLRSNRREALTLLSSHKILS